MSRCRPRRERRHSKRPKAKTRNNPNAPHKGYACSFCQHGQILGRTLRTDRYRLIRRTDPKDRPVQVEWYDHQVDPHETQNVAGRFPDVVEQLTAQLARVPKEAP